MNALEQFDFAATSTVNIRFLSSEDAHIRNTTATVLGQPEMPVALTDE